MSERAKEEQIKERIENIEKYIKEIEQIISSIRALLETKEQNIMQETKEEKRIPVKIYCKRCSKQKGHPEIITAYIPLSQLKGRKWTEWWVCSCGAKVRKFDIDKGMWIAI